MHLPVRRRWLGRRREDTITRRRGAGRHQDAVEVQDDIEEAQSVDVKVIADVEDAQEVAVESFSGARTAVPLFIIIALLVSRASQEVTKAPTNLLLARFGVL